MPLWCNLNLGFVYRVPAAQSMFNGRVPAGSVTYGKQTTETAEKFCSCKAEETEPTCTDFPELRYEDLITQVWK